MSPKIRGVSFHSYVALAIAIQGAVLAIPFGIKVRPSSIYLFPPLAEAKIFLLPIVFVLGGVASITPWLAIRRRTARWLAIAGLACLLGSAGAYAYLASTSLLNVRVPTQGFSAWFVKGDDKTPFAMDKFGPDCTKIEDISGGLSNDCDVAMLEAIGPSDESVRVLWTKESLLIKHKEFLLSYAGCIIGLNLFIGAIAKDALLASASLRTS